ncbi:LysM peptidoglycan-binding domain-containing protein [Halobacillus sp. ACCC02827]|uniref:3D domain-containing protein n=1 Tax=Bacillaceae TaxID=186817 RepID=UPI0004089BE6|nr:MULTISPECIES: 3D domain-containing protein [Bacillaceae]QHT45287.1 LysM peptidoglycan-binding domain-containing protein [Bacillus sp. SB49]WJE16068.1 LysM peptidoglycan-binding domain-containing protein [Halobacillus sp. ACCC02827]
MKKTVVSLAAVASISAVTATSVSAEEVTVNKGDTLWSISQANGVSVEDIKAANGLTSNLIFPDQNLSVDGQSKSADVHTVKPGDTLFSIGQANNVSVSDLKAWNGLDSALIFPGDELKLHSNGEADAAPEASQPVEKEQQEQAPEPAEAEKQEAKAEPTSSEPAQEEAAKTLTMEATAYTAFCEGCSGTTATGVDLRANPDQKVVAVDPDVIPLGSEVYVEGYGKAIAADTGGAIQGNRIDVFVPEQSDALDFGRKTVEVKVLN